MSRLVIFNPAAGQRDTTDSLQQIRAALDLQGDYFVKTTQNAQDAEAFASSAKAEGYDELIVAGGDGTVATVTKGLIESKSTLAIHVVPLGTANVLARYLNLPLNPKEALEASFKAKLIKLDVGYIAEAKRYFLLAAGVGFDADVVKESDRSEKDKFGFAAYFMAMLRQLFERERQHYSVSLDGDNFEVDAHGISIFNIGEFRASGLNFGSDLNAQDGKFNVLVFRDPSIFGVVSDVTQLSLGEDLSSLEMLEAKHISIRSEQSFSSHADGDTLELNQLDISVISKAVSFKAMR